MRSITEHRYTIIVRAAYDNDATDPNDTTYDFIVGSENRLLEYNRVEWTPNNIPKGIDSIITRLEDGVGGGCIWNSDVMIIDNDHPNIIKDFENYGGLKGYFEMCCYKKEATRVLKIYPVPANGTAAITASQLIDKKNCLKLLEHNKKKRVELKQNLMSNHDYCVENNTMTEIEKARECFYPCAIISDRYSGAYSGGEWTAWSGVSAIPDGIFDDDIQCAKTWNDLKHKRDNREILFGVGNTPDEALLDMYRHADYMISWRESMKYRKET